MNDGWAVSGSIWQMRWQTSNADGGGQQTRGVGTGGSSGAWKVRRYERDGEHANTRLRAVLTAIPARVLSVHISVAYQDVKTVVQIQHNIYNSQTRDNVHT